MRRTWLPCLTLLALAAGPLRADAWTDAAKLLGDDFADAKVLARIGEDVVRLDLATRKVTVLARFPKAKRFQGTSRPWWSYDGRQFIVSHGGTCYLFNEDGTGRREVLAGAGPVHEPCFWQVPDTGRRMVVFKDRNYKNGLKRGGGNTWLADLATGEKRKLIGIPCDGGLSRDGTHLGETYRSAAIIDLPNEKIHTPHKGQTCNGTMAPDNSYRMMYLYLPHKYFGVRNKFGKELVKFTNPRGSREWQTPRFSNHPDFGMAVAQYGGGYKPVLVQLSTRKMVVFRDIDGDWRVPHLFLPSAADNAVHATATPLDHLKLTDRADIRRDLAARKDWSGILSQLSKQSDDEARAIVQTLHAWADARIQTAQTAPVADAKAIYAELVARLPGTKWAKQAQSILDSKAFADRLASQQVLAELIELTDRLQPVRRARSVYTDEKFRQRNEPLLNRVALLAARLRSDYPDTPAADQAALLAKRYQLPDKPATVQDPDPLVIRATLQAVSTVPDPARAAYEECITFCRYKVEKVISGQYQGQTLVAATWGMRKAKHTPAASWKPGTVQTLTLEPLDAHKELDHVEQTTDAYEDLSLLPYWIREVKAQTGR